MFFKNTVIVVAVLTSACSAWENLPSIPSGRRSQYFLLQPNGGYKYGYDTGVDHAAKQTASSDNEVTGHFFYTLPTGEKVDLKYTSGINGFLPEGLPVLPKVVPIAPFVPVAPVPYPTPIYTSNHVEDDQSNTGDASYSFTIDTDSYKRQENSDASGNVQGKYSYTDNTGTHEISYVAGSNTGFVASSGSSVPTIPISSSVQTKDASNTPATDGSYSFSYNAGDSSREESADASGNVQGKYAYSNAAGSHSLHYIAGADTGFVTTGGSLAIPNGLRGSASVSPVAGNEDTNNDGSYAFSYNTGDSSRQEGADSAGNVQGRYSYTNEAGSHDLSYSAGADTGFVVTGGSLAPPNGLIGLIPPRTALNPANFNGDQSTNANADGSYSFSYSTGDSSRTESADASGNVQGNYAFTNDAGSHDLSYKAGSETGFVVTGGSLSVPNGILGQVPSVPVPVAQIPIRHSAGSSDDEANTGDSSYQFSIDTDEYKRVESSDSAGNVQGHYSYKNAAGTHDLSYVAGADTGFVAVGGSLKPAPGLDEEQLKSGQADAGVKSIPSETPFVVPEENDSTDSTTEEESTETTEDPQSNSGDSSYSFTIDTDDYKREESSDAAGNVKGSFSYKNAAGVHDLSYVAGAESGFVATGGSLQSAPGLTEPQLKIGQRESAVKNLQEAAPVIPIPSARIPNIANSFDDEANTGDASYKFSIDTDEYKREESSDAAGNVKGSFSYKNSVGTHDLSYMAGMETGFVATGGSLKSAPGLTEAQLKSGEVEAKKVQIPSDGEAYLPPVLPLAPPKTSLTFNDDNSADDEANSGDASYNFSIDTDEYKRHEVSDASGNVKGTYSYKNAVGTHDLSYKAGAETGFVAEGGSLKTPPGLSESQLRTGEAKSVGASGNGIVGGAAVVPRGGFGEESNGDSSYSFTIDTDSYKREESSDAAGNVKGHYSYKNAAGNHELSYVAGADTGFVATDGSLKAPPGLSEHQLNTGIVPLSYYPPQVPIYRNLASTPFVPISPVIVPVGPNPGSVYNANNFWVKTYLPPVNEKQKFGYVFDSQ